MFKAKNTANMQDLIKFVALIAMMIDHYGLYLDSAQGYRVIGRFVFPVFAFYTGYNFHGKMRHLIWVLGAILIGMHIYILNHFMSNILVTLALGQLYLSYVGKAILHDAQTFFRHFIGMLILTPFTMDFIDYGTLGVAWMMVGYKYHNDNKQDEGYLLLATLCTIIFNEYGMSQVFYNLWYALGGVFIVAMAGAWLKYADHSKQIPVNITLITRNMLYIYFVSIVMLLGVVYSRMYL